LPGVITTDLENSGLPVAVVRQEPGASPTVGPLFHLVGEVDEYRNVKNPKTETLESKYVIGVIPVKNEDWLKVKRELETAQQDEEAARDAYNKAKSEGKKKEMAAAQTTLEAAHKHVADLRLKLDATPETRAQEVIEPYNYIKTTVELTGVINVAFRIIDGSGNLIESATPVHQESQESYTILEGVKAEDSQGVKAENAPIDEGAFMTDLEIQVRDNLRKAIHDKVQRLPARVLEEARKLAQQNDLDGAGEWYAIYLNATTGASAEREEALRFLHDRFNISPPA